MDINLVLAMIKRREFAATQRAQGLERDPMLAPAAKVERGIAGGMKALRNDIEAQLAQEAENNP